MGGRVPRRRDRGHERVPELDHIAVGQRDVLELDAGVGRQVGGRARARDERGQAGDVVRLHVRLEDRHDRRARARPRWRGSRRRGRRAGRRPRAWRACRNRTGSWHKRLRRSETGAAASGLLLSSFRPAGLRAATRESRRRGGAPSARALAAGERRRRRRRSRGRGSRRRSVGGAAASAQATRARPAAPTARPECAPPGTRAPGRTSSTTTSPRASRF